MKFHHSRWSEGTCCNDLMLGKQSGLVVVVCAGLCVRSAHLNPCLLAVYGAPYHARAAVSLTVRDIKRVHGSETGFFIIPAVFVHLIHAEQRQTCFLNMVTIFRKKCARRVERPQSEIAVFNLPPHDGEKGRVCPSLLVPTVCCNRECRSNVVLNHLQVNVEEKRITRSPEDGVGWGGVIQGT